MIPRTSILLALSFVCIESAIAGPCKPGTTSTALTSSSETESVTVNPASSTTVVATDSTTSGPSTDSTTASLTLTESSTESTTRSVPVSSDSTTLSTSEATTSATSTSPQPDSTPFNIIPGADSSVSGLLKVRTTLGGSVLFDNEYETYQTGVFVVNGLTRQLVERGSQRICAFFRTGQGYGDLTGCRPEVNPDRQQFPITCQLTASEELRCSVAGKYCTRPGDFLTCEDRGVYSSLYLGALSSAGYSVIIGPSGLSLSPVELVAAPLETQ
ncbi:hypothetical protein CEP54_006585 [Fusarium duplospermum]|uniref:Uncharacterized protein n=1 Tax=Fusarium duplospermum TaxID=1325734 RepID=A0A428Q624_9HYPO|nr:hypothetical protein CEP54_006585 [Fusarium duplospermum]